MLWSDGGLVDRHEAVLERVFILQANDSTQNGKHG